MGGREGLLEVLNTFRSRRAAVAGIRAHTLVEAEAAAEAAFTARVPVIIMVSAARANLDAFVRAVRGLAGGTVFVQLIGESSEPLARAALAAGADAVYLVERGAEAARRLCEALKGRNVLTEVVLPWHETAPGRGTEGRIVDCEAARSVVDLPGLDVAAVPVGGGPGPYKTWRIPLWAPEAFARAAALRGEILYSLPWGSLLSKNLLEKYNRYGGALPGVVSLPAHQFRAFVAAGAVKISFRSDCALAFLGGLRESFFERPEVIDVSAHIGSAQKELTSFLEDRLRELALH